ncbi:nuclear transport factor 2 family protein [Rubellimicrobium roseum]|uniref:Nuclear transport factor 2 family protein n=1 Tax=Rubellimicrobium roseum TaxID=687525 RepID=A0A5C4NAY7_9RHOB|nr:nuclear transport factor 2 family protein [Rubellimicrobium roseum]TNC65508.1 nuclear transport factor 2 family protein [Rubellimicrobium roseum]
MQLPPAIDAFFEAETRNDVSTVEAAFSQDATVKDEGAEHSGSEAIGAWWRAAKAKYRHVAEPLDATATDGRTVVRARVTGQFPGSPATLTFAFTLADDRIARLEIG